MECLGENFCCRVGAICSRDASGIAICLDPNGMTQTPPSPTGTFPTAQPNANGSNTGRNSNTINAATNTGTTASPSPSSNNPFGNINPFKKNAALPQVTVASGLTVTVAFLSAFLVGPLTFSHKIIS